MPLKLCSRGNFQKLDVYINKKQRSQINDFIFHFKKPEKEEQIKHNVSKTKEIINRAEINEIENRKIKKNQWNQKLVI